MAIAHDPLLPEFYVYVFYVRGVPFYVGEGRSSRASDRVRFVRYLIDREAAGKPVTWVKSNRVIAEFLRRGEEVGGDVVDVVEVLAAELLELGAAEQLVGERGVAIELLGERRPLVLLRQREERLPVGRRVSFRPEGRACSRR